MVECIVLIGTDLSPLPRLKEHSRKCERKNVRDGMGGAQQNDVLCT